VNNIARSFFYQHTYISRCDRWIVQRNQYFFDIRSR